MTIPRLPDAPLGADRELASLRALRQSLGAARSARADTSLQLARETPAPAARQQATTARAFGVSPDALPSGMAAPSPLSAFMKDDAPLQTWLGVPSNAAQAQDDLPALSSLSWLLKQQPQAVVGPSVLKRTATVFGASLRQNTEVYDARWSQMIREFTPEEDLRVTTLSQALARQQRDAGADLPGVVRVAAETAPSMLRGILDTGTGAAIGGTIGALAGLAGGPFAEVTVPGGVIFGAKAGAAVGGLLSAIRSEGASHLDAVMQSVTAAGNKISQSEARAQAWAVGLLNGAIEVTTDALLVGLLPGFRNLLPTSLIPSALRETTGSAVSRAIGTRTTREAVTGFAKAYGAVFATEAAEEGLQAIAPGLSNIALNVANEDGQRYGLGDVGRDIVESGAQAAQAMVLLGVPVPFANYAAQQVRVSRAQSQAQYFEALAEAAKGSTLIREAPETAADAIRSVAPNAPTVYVPAQVFATYFQAAGVQPEVAAQELLGDAGQYVTAMSLGGVGTGGLIAIPMDVYASKLAASKFHEAVAGDLKLDPNDLSANESKAIEKELADPVAVARMLDEMQAAVPQPVEGEEAVRQNVSAQLQQAGVTPEQAAPLAQLHALVYRSLAQRSQQSVTDLQTQRAVTILGGRDAQNALRPSAALAPDGIPRNLSALSAADFDAAMARVAGLRDADFAEANLIPENIVTAVEEEGAAGAEDLRGAIEQAGYSAEEWADLKARMAKAKFVLAARERSVARFTAEQARRAAGGVVRQSSADLSNGPDIYADAATDVVDDFLGPDGQTLFQVGNPVDGRTLYQSASEYQGNHKPPGPSDGAPASDLTGDGTVYPDDVYGPNGLQYYGTGMEKADRESFAVLRRVRGKPSAIVTIYRAVPLIESEVEQLARLEKETALFLKRGTMPDGIPESARRSWYDGAAQMRNDLRAKAENGTLSKGEPISINAGDWVTTSKAYAQEHGEAALRGSYRIVSKKVRAGEIFTNGDSFNEFGYWPGDSERVFFQQQQDAEANGFIQFTEDGHRVTIGLLKTADLSTFLHESAHLFAEMLLDTAARDGASPTLQADAQTIRDWLGVPTGPLTREQHEQFARGFESYLGSAKAPSADLAELFGRFRAWIISVYKDLRGLNVELTDEVRSVFDRMIAGEDAVTAAQSDVQAGRFTSAEQGQMTPEQFAIYQQHGGVAAEAFAARLQARLREETTRESRQWWKDETARRTAELTAALQEQPVYQALAALAGDEKLPRQWVEDFYGPDARKTLTAKKLTAKEGGVDPASFASAYGFTTEGDLIAALLTAEGLEAVVRREVAASMARDYGTLLGGSPAMAAATQAALHEAAGDPMAQLLVEELEALGRVRGIAVPARIGSSTLATVRRLAKDVIGRHTLQQLKPHGYLVAERKAAREVESALAAGNQQEAYTAKRRQLLNHVLYAEGIAAVTESREARRTLMSYTTTKVRAKIGKVGQAWLEQIDGLLERVDLKQRSVKATDAIADLRAFIVQKVAEGDPLVASLQLATELPAIPYQTLTVQQMRDLRDAVLVLATGARREGQAQTLAKGVTQDEIREKLSAEAIATGRVAPKGGDRQSPSVQRAAKRRAGAWKLRTLPSLVRELGGGNETSAWWTYLLRPLNDSAVREGQLLRESAAAMAEVNSVLTKADLSHPGRETFTMADGRTLSTRQRLALVLNTGTEGNQQRLRDGNKITDSDMARVRESLSDTQLRWVQGVWDLLDSFWPETEALAKRLDGVAPEKVEAIPFVVRGVQYRGGYYRLKYDASEDARANLVNDMAQAKDYVAGSAFRGQTKHGSRIERLEKVSSPVRLDLRVIDEHLAEVIHDLTHAEVLRDVNSVLRGPDLTQTMVDTIGPELWAVVKETLKDVTRNGRPLEQESASAEKFARHVSLFGVGWNILSGVINLTNFTSSAQRIGSAWVLRGIYQTFANSAKLESTRQLVHEKSEFMRQRGVNQLRSAGEANTDTFETEGVTPYLRAVNKAAYTWMGFTQQAVDLPTWLGAYQKGVAQGLDEDTAVRVADQAIVEAQGSSSVKDQSLVMRQRGAVKLFTALHGYMSTQYNLLASSNRLTLQSGTRMQQTLGLTSNVLMTIVLPAVLGKLLRDAIRDDDDESAGDFVAEIIAYTFSLAPGTRELAGLFQGYTDYDGPAGARLAEAVGRAALGAQRAFESGDVTESTLRAINDAAGLYFGYPGVQLDRTVRGIAALLDGTSSNPLAPAIGPPRIRR